MQTNGNRIVIAAFLAMLYLPAVLAAAGFARADSEFLLHTEQRLPFVAPPVSRGALATAGYERDLERQIGDAFPLRSQLITAYGRFVYGLGGTTTHAVVRGRDGWLFYAKDERPYVMGTGFPRPGDLVHIADVYAARARWCAQRGITYVALFAPNKTSIYADDAPAWYRPVRPTALDRLLPLLAARGVIVVDVRASLIAAARDGEVYQRGDTHWNGAGAYVAYRALLPPLRRAGFIDRVRVTGTRVVTSRGDLLAMTGVAGTIPNRDIELDFPQSAVAASPPPYAAKAAARRLTVTAWMVADPHLPSLVLIGDSFSDELVPLLADDARRLVHLRGQSGDPQFERDLVAAERPDAVVQELVERSLAHEGAFHE